MPEQHAFLTAKPALQCKYNAILNSINQKHSRNQKHITSNYKDHS